MKNTNNNLKTKKGLIIFLALVIILYVIIYVVPKVSDIFTQTYIAEYGTLEVSEKTECVFVRDETVYKAQSGGSVKQEAQEGTLLRVGSPVVSVGDSVQYNEKKGVVSYHYDGFESKATPETMTELGISFISEYKESAGVQETVSKTAESGNVIYKIIDNSCWYLVCWFDEDKASAFEEGRKVTVDFGDGNRIPMNVSSIAAQDNKVRVIFSCNRNYEDFDKYRIKECTIISSSYSGIILNTDSITEKDGVKGVYVVDKYNQANFTPIKILSSQNGKTVVEKNYFYDEEGKQVETVGTYAEILKSGKK